MNPSGYWKPALLVAGLSLLVGPLVASSLTNSITMPGTHLSLQQTEVTADSLKPDECGDDSAMSRVITGADPLIGTSDNDLILGTAGGETIDGGAGNDCIVSGDGADVIDGGDGYDVCIATLAASFSNCEERFP